MLYLGGGNHHESNDNNSASPLALLDFIREFFFSKMTIYNKGFPFGGTEDNTFKLRRTLLDTNIKWRSI